MLLELAILLISLVALAWSANLVSDKAVVLSEYFHISQMAVGFLLIAASTSIPELAVALASAASGQGAISAGNVFGANVADVLWVAGMCAFAYGLRVKKEDAVEVGAVLIATTAITLYFIYSAFVIGSPLIGQAEGFVLIVAFLAYVYYILRQKKFPDGNGNQITKRQAATAFILFFAGIGLVLISSTLVVEYVVTLSSDSGLSRSLIGGTVVAMGTTLPELSVGLASARKRRYGLAIGNAVGSTIINITLVLGAGALLHPIVIAAPASFLTILLFAIFSNTIIFYLAFAQHRIGKWAGTLLILLYITYIASLLYAEMRF
jgi:cation:H+ antiporter